MERFTISLDQELEQEFERLIADRGYQNRSEAVRDLLRSRLEERRFERNEAKYCVANLSFVYNHHERSLAERLAGLQHDNHDLIVSAMHVHLDHENCIESIFLRGLTTSVRGFANSLIAEPGVRHGRMNVVSLQSDAHPHTHINQSVSVGHAHRHIHLKPKS